MKNKSVIVFDMDETLGFFSEFSVLWYSVKNILNIKKTQEIECFIKLLDLYPELIRPNIFKILKYLVKEKNTHKFDIMIYTNNQGGKEWVNLLAKYFESKIQGLKFNKIIYAFKIDGKIIEPNRTSHIKKFSDFIKTTKMPRNVKVCFIDDVHFPEMETNNVFYIHIKPYTYHISNNLYLSRIKRKNIYNLTQDNVDKLNNSLKEQLNIHLSMSNNIIEEKNKHEQDVDIIVSKQILVCIEDFINNL